ncbi:MAG: GspE/PulE family protein [Hyphomicrobiaceae bacterium]
MADVAAKPRNGPGDPRSADFVARFGAALVADGVLDRLQLARAERAHKQAGERFDMVLIGLGLVSEDEMAMRLAAFLGLELAGVDAVPRRALLRDQIDLDFLRRNRVLPLLDDGATVTIAVADPFATDQVTGLAYLLGRPVHAVVMPRGLIERGIERLYSAPAAANAARAQAAAGSSTPIAASDSAPIATSETDLRRLADIASDAPVIKLVQDLITRAWEAGASDIHLEPGESSLDVRLRIDGVLAVSERLAPDLQAAVASRIKVMAELNIAERRLPQDGRIRANVRGNEIDLRVSTMPTISGESVVMRILDRKSLTGDFAELGFAAEIETGLARLIARPTGIVLVTGPTGSGKTTTLYTALNRLNTSELKILTVEDPIEYRIAGINQVQVQPRIGLTFAHTLRSMLRQDPDVIMVGEIRDLDTARIAVQASLTGHLVLSTLHTNSAAGTIARLLDMGVADYLLASSVNAILAQRLVRRLCEACAKPLGVGSGAHATVARLLDNAAHLDAPGLRERVGCPSCRGTGYAGRHVVGELMFVDDPVRRAILAGPSEQAIEAAAKTQGMTPLLEQGLALVLLGQTTLDEILRVARAD